MRWGKLSLIILIGGGLLGFNILFKNILVKRAMEAGLQSIFKAKAEVKGVQLEILKGRLYFNHLEVADADAPMKNLFELGKTEFRLNPSQLLKGRFVSENIECQGIQWNTDRKISGALPYQKKKAKKKKNKAEENQSPAPLGDLAKIDAKAIVQKHIDKLGAPRAVSNSKKLLNNLNSKWKKRISDDKQQIAGLGNQIKRIKKINVSAIKTLPQATTALKTVNSSIESVKKIKSEIDNAEKALSDDAKKAKAGLDDIKKAVDKDMKYLKSLIHIPEGGAKGLVAGLARKILAEKLGAFYSYGTRALYYARLLNNSSPKDKKEKKEEKLAARMRRTGEKIYFPGGTYPDFLLMNLASSITNKRDRYYFDARIQNISSDPNLWNKPILYRIHQNNKGEDLKLTGLIDVRSNSNDAFRISFSALHMPFHMDQGMEWLNISNMSGQYNFSTTLDFKKKGGNNGSASLIIKSLKVKRIPGGGKISEVIYDVLTSSDQITLKVKYTRNQNGGLKIKISSNLDREIQKRVGKLIDDMVAKAESELKKELNKRLGVSQQDLAKAKATFDDIQAIANGNTASLKKYQAELDKKKKEINARIEMIKKEAENKVKQQLQNKIKIPKNVKIPGF